MKNNPPPILIILLLTLPISLFSQSISRTMTFEPAQLDYIRSATTPNGSDS